MMTTEHKAMRHCVPCNTTGDHTSLDHSMCPKKREIIKERIRINRVKREDQIQSVDKDIHIFKDLIDQTFSNTQPTVTMNEQQTQLTTIITMALIDEAFNPGVFQNKLVTQCEANGLQPVKYSLEPNTAKNFVKTLSGSKDLNVTQNLPTETMRISKFSKDLVGGKKYTENLAKFNQTAEERLMTMPELIQGDAHLIPRRRRLSNFNAANGISCDSIHNLTQGQYDIHPEGLRQFMGTNPIQRTHTQDLIQKKTTESSDISASGSCTLNELSQRTVDLNPDYLRYISSLSQSKVSYISDSSDSSDY